MPTVLLDYGTERMEAALPDDAVVVRYGQTYTDPPAVDPAHATRRALAKPSGLPPLKDLAGPGKRAVIGFPDRVKGGMHALSHRKVAIPLIVEELLSAGTRLEDITLLCGMGLHRKNRLDEFREMLGDELVERFVPGRLVNHDAETDILELGQDAMGNTVECNRLLAQADVPIVAGHCTGNPYGGFSGGYKMLVTGFTGWRSIASHHCPATMHRDDWMGATPRSHMRRQFSSIGRAIEEKIGKRVFAVDAVLGQKSEVLDVQAGALDAVEKATWPLAEKRTCIRLGLDKPANVLVMGLPRDFHYGPGMGTNPILLTLAIAGQLSRCWHAFEPGGVVIAATACDGWFNPDWFPSYEATYKAMGKHKSPEDFLASAEARKIVADEKYLSMYSCEYTYHPFHAMSMLSGGALLRKRAAAVLAVGAKAPEFATGMGLQPVETFEAALDEAKAKVNGPLRILCTPEAFSGGVGVHLSC